MASMSTVLQAQHEDYITARQIMDNLEDMFDGQAAEKRQETLRNLINYRQKAGSSIKVHMLKVMGYLADSQTNGANIDAEVDARTLKVRADDQGVNYYEANFTEASSSKPSLRNGRKKKRAKKESSSIPPNKGKNNKKKKNLNKLKCFHRGKVGHMKKNYKDYLASTGKGGLCDLLIVGDC
ncbi:uncharacterized protein LOC112093265 [Morus notabilis]|uniref:uncharacterized protein LOC112093265 n=1 Tax=Morus notabilis TaxID=981085 RepID=UPI000CECE9AF|nr:uncharacterized protein LOC112093265 [Morus notabilis]